MAGGKKRKIPFRPVLVTLLYVLVLLLALSGVFSWGSAIKRQALDGWLEKAADQTQEITTISLNWMASFHIQLRGLAAAFYGSQKITAAEFLDILDVVEGVEQDAIIPLTTLAYAAAPPERGEADAYPVLYSTDNTETLALGHDLLAAEATAELVRSALRHMDKVVRGPVFQGAADTRYLPLAMSVPNEGRWGVLVSVVNLSDFIEDLYLLHIPKGLNLRVFEPAMGDGDGGRWVIGSEQAPEGTVETFYYRTGRGTDQWEYYWDVAPSYLGGVDYTLGKLVQWGGSLLVISVFAVIGFLALQNLRINRLVKYRTKALVQANRAAEKANIELTKLANHDPLTNACNRRRFLELLTNAQALSRRTKSPLSLIMLDVDYFKAINDQYGHECGDRALIQLVETGRKVLREVDRIGRLGGEEFAILLPDTSLSGGCQVAERLRQAIADLRLLSDQGDFSITASMGIAQWQGDKESVNQWLKRADDALYRAKHEGRNRVVQDRSVTDAAP